MLMACSEVKILKKKKECYFHGYGAMLYMENLENYSVPHYKTGFLIFGHFVDYLQNHAISTHNTSK